MHLLASAVWALAHAGFIQCLPSAIRPRQPRPKLTAYKNPIISGFAPDPSCIRVDEQFYCVTSSFSAFPGIPIYTSRDLIQWEQIGNVLSRPEQLPGFAQVNQSTGGIWAATIRHHENKFYVTTTLVFDGAPQDSVSRWDNLLFTSTNISSSSWSDPIHFSFQGYDTSLFFDTTTVTTTTRDPLSGKLTSSSTNKTRVYVQGSHAWHVFPAIQQFELDLETGKSLSGEPRTLWTGTGGIAPEGPHLYKRDDGFYYLLIAEGGTGLGHMVTMARSKNIWGPYDPCPFNPVLTNANTTEYLQTVGHADLFQDTNNNWWAVSLATRNATVNFPMGRETVLVPVHWEEGQFPVFNGGKPGRVHVDMQGPLPPSKFPLPDQLSPTLVGHSQHIEFTSLPLPRQLIYYRYPDFSLFSLAKFPFSISGADPASFSSTPSSTPNSLRILPSAQNLTGNLGLGTASFIARRQDALEFSAQVTLAFEPQAVGEEAGVSLFLQRGMRFDLGVVGVAKGDASGGRNVTKELQFRAVTATASPDGLSDNDPLTTPGVVELREGAGILGLRVRAVSAALYEFGFRYEGVGSVSDAEKAWTTVGFGAANEVSGGFTGTVIGMYATGNGRSSTTPAYFKDFKYDVVPGVFWGCS